MKCTGAEIVLNCLKEQGVDTVFGYPGGTILNIYDALYKTPEIRHILTSHEQGAAHAADGYARATGKTGVVFATSGPGATNLVTGIATAYMDSVPLVAITCNVAKGLIGTDSFQEIDIVGVTMPITKYSVLVKDVGSLAKTIRRAFQIAGSGRKGPVLVDITKDATAAEAEYEFKAPGEIPAAAEYTQEEIKTGAKMINKAQKPYIFVGGGASASGAVEEIKALADLINAPVCDSLMGKGTFNGIDPKYMGMLGMHGTKTSNLGMYKCDLLIVLGARFSDRDVGNPKSFTPAKILQIDIDKAEIDKNVKVDASIIGDIKDILKVLLPLIEKKEDNSFLMEMEEMSVKYPLSYDMDSLTGPAVIKEIYRATAGNATIVTDVGQHQMWAAQYYKYTRPRQLITSGGLGTMGYGLGAAIGAKIGDPDKTVVNIAGDGCFRMNLNELATVSRSNVPIIQVILNNKVLGMVRQWQTLFYEGRYSSTVLDDKVDFVKVSKALGVKAVSVSTVEEFKIAFANALESKEPMTIECLIEKDDKVFPMIPAGKPNKDVFDANDIKKE